MLIVGAPRRNSAQAMISSTCLVRPCHSWLFMNILHHSITCCEARSSLFSCNRAQRRATWSSTLARTTCDRECAMGHLVSCTLLCKLDEVLITSLQRSFHCTVAHRYAARLSSYAVESNLNPGLRCVARPVHLLGVPVISYACETIIGSARGQICDGMYSTLE